MNTINVKLGKIKKRFNILLFYLFIVLVLVGCGNKTEDTTQYDDKANWAYYPQTLEHDVDVFFIAPTSGSEESFNMKMDDKEYKDAFKGATAMEKGIYDTKADFYAPYYRQVSLECYLLPEKEREQYLKIAYEDIEEAFEYYINNLNNGRPYILAGFSQGGDMIKRLLEQNKNAGENMIAAYAIGWNFPADEIAEYPAIKMAQGESDTGVVVSFCSESPDYNEPGEIVPTTTIGINPLNWKTDGTVATKEENLGACFTDYSGEILNEVPALCGAYLDDNRGTLKVTDVTPDDYPGGLEFLEDGNYHLYDYQFFYRNLQKNVEKRIDSWFSNKSIENLDVEYTGKEVRHIEDSIDIYNLPDGTYPVKIFFDEMKRNGDSLSLDFMIYSVIHYDPDEIRNLKQGDIIYEYVDETTTENYMIDTVNFPLDEVCVINGGSERGDGLTLSLDESGFFIVSVNEAYTRHAARGVVTFEVPDSVAFEDNHDLRETKLKGSELYNYFKGLSATEEGYFNENNTFITVEDGKVTKFYRTYLP